MATDQRTQQAQRYQDYYRYMMHEATTAIERYVFGGANVNLEEAVRYAKIAREHREKWDELSSFPKVLNTPNPT